MFPLAPTIRPLAVAMVSALLLINPAWSASVRWNEAVGGSWTDASKWLFPNFAVGVPGGNDDVFISAEQNPVQISPYTVSVPNLGGTGIQVNSVNMSSGSAKLSIAAGAKLHTASFFSVTDGLVEMISCCGGPNELQADGGISVAGGALLRTSFSWLTGNISNSARMELGASYVLGSTLNNSGTVVLQSGGQFSRVASHTENSGLLLFQNGGADMNGITNLANGTVRVDGGVSRTGNVNLYDDLENFGRVELTKSTAAPAHAIIGNLAGYDGALINHLGGVVDIQAGNGGERTIAALLDNRGVVEIGQDLGLTAALSKGTNSNSGTINLNGGGLSVGGALDNSGTISGNGGDLTVGELTNTTTGRIIVGGGAYSTHGNLRNDGFMDISAGGFSSTSADTVDLNGTLHVAAGNMLQITRNSVGLTTVNIGADASVGGGADIHIGAVTTRNALNLEGDFTPANSNLYLSAMNVGGAGRLINQRTLQSYAGWHYLDVLNQTGGEFLVTGDTRFFGLRNEQGGTVRMEGYTGSYSVEHARVNLFDDDLVNAGLLELGRRADSAAQVTINNYASNYTGSLVNDATGVVDVQTGGVRRINVQTDNRGLLNVRTMLEMHRTGARHVNSGTINLANGAELSIQGDTFTNTASGVIQGNGILNTRWINFIDHGMISPGNSYGRIEIAGDYTQGLDAILEMEIGADGQDELLISSGTGTFSGILHLIFIDGFAPTQGQTFNLITGSVIENFADIQLFNLLPSFDYALQSDTAGLQLTALNDAQAAVPLPAAIWLFGAALPVLLGFSRRAFSRPVTI